MADEATKKDEKQIIEVHGFSFEADLDLLDDVNAFAIIDRIENKGQIAAIVPLLNFLVGEEETAKMQEYFVELDRKEHEGEKNYRARMRIEKLNDVYMAIIEKYNPKG